jgi:dTDP-4-dehydrorhamnose 3,5-epimerase
LKLLDVMDLALDGVKAIRFGRFRDERGYFTETWRRSDFQQRPELAFLRGIEFGQANESLSRAGTVRGLHLQWNPYMGKLVRTVSGRMVDLVVDLRKGSPGYGKAIAYDMPYDPEADHSDWIWVPPGFAHGNYFTIESRIEYLCTGEYSPGCEAGLSPLADDLDWSPCDPRLKAELDSIVAAGPLMSAKDRDGPSLAQWSADARSEHFLFGRL